MTERVREEEVRESLWELGRYLSDELAPLMAADSIRTLMLCPIPLTAQAIGDWAATQNRGIHAQLSFSDCAFHSLKKVRHIGELDLVPRSAVEEFIAQLAPLLIERCPAAERARFAESLGHLGDGESSLASTVHFLHRPPGAAGPYTTGSETGPVNSPIAPSGHVVVAVPSGTVPVVAPAGAAGAVEAGVVATGSIPPAPEAAGSASERDYAQNLARMGLVMERLEQHLRRVETTASAGTPSTEALSRLIEAAAVSARSSGELAAQLKKIGQMGVDTPVGEMLRSIGRQMPGWVLKSADGRDAVELPKNKTMEAMRRLVEVADNEQETATRFHELLVAAAERFNAGSLAQCASILAAGREIIDDKRIAPASLATILDRAARTFSEEKLAHVAARTEDHPLLREVLEFFPALRPERLLSELQEEPKRERRQLLLSILRAHGGAARAAILAHLDLVAARSLPDELGFFRRNLIFLLRRLPRGVDEAPEREVDHYIALAVLSNPLIVVKESIGALGGVRDTRAERALGVLLDQVENALVKPGYRAPYPESEMRGLLDRLVAALAAQETKSAARIIANHAFREEPQLGHPITRLAALSRIDLSDDRELVETLVGALESELPRKLLKFVVKPRVERIVALIQGLAGTSAPQAREALQTVARSFPQEEYGRAAAKALQAPPPAPSAGLTGDGATRTGARPAAGTAPAPPAPGGAAAAPSSAMSGDIDLFGLPNLMQSLASTGVTGKLALRDRDGNALGALYFERGKIAAAAAGRLRGEAAVYQLIELPAPGRFSFSAQAGDDAAGAPEPEPLDAIALLMEGVRRHDEFRLARTVVPDDARLEPAGIKPTVPEAETDVAFLKRLWALAVAGESAAACEVAFPCDSYRTRYALAHWVETKALRSR
ncbi:MAG: DUF4388 domain-containing protein [Acidobacteria bacterium]|nr:DUF4388 domain-containing protein [Acidobacteriota bacterium]